MGVPRGVGCGKGGKRVEHENDGGVRKRGWHGTQGLELTVVWQSNVGRVDARPFEIHLVPLHRLNGTKRPNLARPRIKSSTRSNQLLIVPAVPAYI